MNYRVVISPSPFRENEILGDYKNYWRAYLAALWHVHFVNGCAIAHILKRV